MEKDSVCTFIFLLLLYPLTFFLFLSLSIGYVITFQKKTNSSPPSASSHPRYLLDYEQGVWSPMFYPADEGDFNSANAERQKEEEEEELVWSPMIIPSEEEEERWRRDVEERREREEAKRREEEVERHFLAEWLQEEERKMREEEEERRRKEEERIRREEEEERLRREEEERMRREEEERMRREEEGLRRILGEADEEERQREEARRRQYSDEEEIMIAQYPGGSKMRDFVRINWLGFVTASIMVVSNIVTILDGPHSKPLIGRIF
jgi:hypothetical protein